MPITKTPPDVQLLALSPPLFYRLDDMCRGAASALTGLPALLGARSRRHDGAADVAPPVARVASAYRELSRYHASHDEVPLDFGNFPTLIVISPG